MAEVKIKASNGKTYITDSDSHVCQGKDCPYCK